GARRLPDRRRGRLRGGAGVVLAITRIRAAGRGFLGRRGPERRHSRGTIDGRAPHPDRLRMPRCPRSEWLTRAVNMPIHIVAAPLGRDALRQLVGVARDAPYLDELAPMVGVNAAGGEA